MNSSKKHWQNLQHDSNAELGQFVALNQDILAELLTFIDFSEKFTLGFIEINFPPDGDLLIEALITNSQCEEIQFVILKFADPNLRFLRDEIIKELPKIEREVNKKLVLIIQGLEKSIGVFGEYPPFLQDLNFVRDAYKKTVPYPILFVLPDYAINRLAKFAPDFWAWRSGVFRFKTLEKTRENAITQTLESNIKGVFRFKTLEKTRENAITQTLESNIKIDRIEPQEKQERIEILQSLLMEYKPTSEKTNDGNLRRYSNILLELGTAYISQHQAKTAREYLAEALQIAEKLADVNFKRQVLNKIGDVYREERKFETAINYYQQGLDIAKELKNRNGESYALFKISNAYLDLRQFLEARKYYQQCLEIYQELDDHDNQANTYHQLGRVAQEMREYAQARDFYQQALSIKIEFGDRYSQASTYHQLGIVAQEMREYAQARDFYQQALSIKIEFGDRFSQALTYHCLGTLAEAQEDYTEARVNLQKALEIYVESKDEYWGNITREILERLPE
ncbi:MAG: tetratricopeptide repeat protein [Aphanizomenon gracile PMC644.10]|nr:tetratricopeptide repeat protein [Aphanizomenon gracile PMC644.10]